MRKRAILTLSLLTMFISSLPTASIYASSLNYTTHGDKVSVALSLDFHQNATAIPTENGAFTGQSAQELTNALDQALKSKDSNVSVFSVSGQLASAAGWINSTINFEISGASIRKGNLLVFNCSWIPFNVSRDLRFGGISYNLIGAAYIRPAFEKYVDFDKPPLNETIADVAYVAAGNNLPAIAAVNRAGNATLLDFRNLVLPFDDWERNFNVSEGVTTWSYNPELAVDMEMTVTPREGTPFVSRAFYSYNATVTVDGLAQTTGDTITTEASAGFQPPLMLAVVIVTFVLAVAASWTYRSRRRQMLRKRK